MVHGAVADLMLASAAPSRDWLAGPGTDWCAERVDGHAGHYTAHEDAFAVHAAVKRLGVERVELEKGPRVAPSVSERMLPDYDRVLTVGLPALVMSAAIDGRAPDWEQEAQLSVRRGDVVYARGRNGVVAQDKRGRRVELMCIVSYEGRAPWMVERSRAIYGAWWRALDGLRESVGAAVQSMAVSAAMPPRKPWAGD